MSPGRSGPGWKLFGAALASAAVAAALLFLGIGPFKRALRTQALAALEQRFAHARIGERVDLSWPLAVALGPLELALSPDGPPVVSVQRVQVRPSLTSLLRLRPELESVEVRGVRVEAGTDGRDLQQLVEKTRSSSGKSGGETDVTVSLSDVVVAAQHDEDRFEFGPFSGQASLVKDSHGKRAAAKLELPGGGTMAVSMPPAGAETGFAVEFDKASVVGLSVPTVELKLDTGVLSGSASWSGTVARVALELDKLVVAAPKLAPTPVGPMRVRLDGDATWDPATRQISTNGFFVRLGDVDDAPIRIGGSVTGGDNPQVTVTLGVENVGYSRLVEGLPPQLSPGDIVSGVDGPFSASVAFSGPLRDRESWDLTLAVDLSEFRKVARVRPSPLLSPFTYNVLLSKGRGRPIVVGPTNPYFVPYALIPRMLVRSVLVSEDGAFFTHAGFDFESLEEKLLAEHHEGEIVRGGSSISQQLAKNLFLNREKSYARKLKEAFVTLALEATVPKERLLEIYLNIIEWGPDLYGIGEAARHYFAKPASELTLRESAFLASIIPNPVKFHVYCQRGAMTKGWNNRVNWVIEKLHSFGELDDMTYAMVLEDPVVFHHR